jgi:hypothetical protein
LVERRRRRIAYRLRERTWPEQDRPMMRASNIHYEVADKDRGLGEGGIAAMHLLAQRVGLVERIDQSLHLLKRHLPYHESDHVLNIAYNLLAGGTCLDDLELRRNDEVYLDALGAQRIPDPTTAGDFCRRFSAQDLDTLTDAINQSRVEAWRQQEPEFFAEAFIDVDGHLAETQGECKQGMSLSYDGRWGFHPLIVSLANTHEPLYLPNRSGSRPSHEGAAPYLDRAAGLCRGAGFRKITFRGDTDFSQTEHLDRWHGEGFRFIFGYDARPELVKRANDLPDSAWTPLPRETREVKTEPRARPENVKERIVAEKGYENILLLGEEVAEFEHQPTACRRSYRMIVVRKHLSMERGQERLYEDYRYFFYLTNDRRSTAAQVVALAHGRCDQENLIEQLKNGVHALRMPVGDLVSNGAYMIMAALAWSLKAWFALLLPVCPRWKEPHRRQKETMLGMEFKRFVNAFVRVPAQVVRSGRRLILRLLSWNPWQAVLLRGIEGLRRPLRC